MNKFAAHRFIKALNRQPVDRTPVWVMRQAGRYLPEYRALRTQAGNFLNLCHNPELAALATLMPIQRFGFDAAILFSDILLIPHAMGLGLEFVQNEGPVFAKTITCANDVANLPHVDVAADLGFVSAAIKNIVQELKHSTPLIGFAGSPWTVASYMVEGGTSKHFYKLKGLMYAQPRVMHNLLAHMTLQITNALQAQIDAGVSAVMLFDSWGGILTDANYLEFSLRYMQEIVQALQAKNPQIPIILFTKNGGRCLEQIAETGCTAIGLDWTASLSAAKHEVGNRVALQGNLDPCVLYANDEQIRLEVQQTLEQFGNGPGHIFNLGHGIAPDVDPAKVAVMLDAVHTYSPAFNNNLTLV